MSEAEASGVDDSEDAPGMAAQAPATHTRRALETSTGSCGAALSVEKLGSLLTSSYSMDTRPEPFLASAHV